MRENKFQASLIKELKDLFPGCVVLKNDASYIQGFPDLLILYEDRWAALECKRNEEASRQRNATLSNQHYYVDKLDEMSFASFIYPENKEDVLDELQRAFESRRKTRYSRSK